MAVALTAITSAVMLTSCAGYGYGYTQVEPAHSDNAIDRMTKEKQHLYEWFDKLKHELDEQQKMPDGPEKVARFQAIDAEGKAYDHELQEAKDNEARYGAMLDNAMNTMEQFSRINANNAAADAFRAQSLQSLQPSRNDDLGSASNPINVDVYHY